MTPIPTGPRLTAEGYRELFDWLEACTPESSDFHETRQMADKLLILDGWQVVPDATFEGGFRWFWGNYSSSESTRPFPIHDPGAALGLVPRGCNVRLEIIGDTSKALIWQGDNPTTGAQGNSRSNSPAVALCAAFVKWKWMGR